MANALTDLIAAFQPQANATAASAADAALDSAAARPFHVIITVDQQTRDWITLLAVGILIGGVLLKKI